MGGQANTNSTFGSSNFSGSIQSTVSANTTAGFSIVSYTGSGSNATIGHGLGSASDVVIIKERTSAGEWVFGHTSLGFTKFIEMNSTGASQTNSARFNDTAPTSSVFSIGTANDVNTSGNNHIAYCLVEKKATQNLEATQEMEMLMGHLFIQDLNQLGFYKKI